MKIVVIGADGFLGFNLRLKILSIYPKSEIISVDTRLNYNTGSSYDVLFFLAAVNRTKKNIIEENLNIYKGVIEFCDKNKIKKIIYSNSIQIYNKSEYGTVKNLINNKLKTYCQRKKIFYCNVIMPNLYGPFGKANYNSVVSTFVYNVVNSIKCRVDNNNLIELLDINTACNVLSDCIDSSLPEYYEIAPSPNSSINLLDLLKKIKNIHLNYSKNIFPKLNSVLEKIIYNMIVVITYKKRKFILNKNEDERGYFIELNRSNSSGQLGLSTTKPGVIRGNHFHIEKPERFIYYSGSLEINIRRIFSDKTTTFKVDDGIPKVFDIPVGHTHNLKNTGSNILTMFFFTSDFYDSKNPDTFFHEV